MLHYSHIQSANIPLFSAQGYFSTARSCCTHMFCVFFYLSSFVIYYKKQTCCLGKDLIAQIDQRVPVDQCNRQRKLNWMKCIHWQWWSEVCCTSSSLCSSFSNMYEHIYIISNVSLLLASTSACSSVTMVTAVRLGWQLCESKHLCFTVAPDASENQIRASPEK